MTLRQLPLFEAVRPYHGQVPHNATDTSKEAAAAIAPRLGAWQRRVLLALYAQPGLSDEGLEAVLDCRATRTSRPRRKELELAGYVEDSGERCIGIGGTHVIMWRLSAKGERAAAALIAAEEGRK